MKTRLSAIAVLAACGSPTAKPDSPPASPWSQVGTLPAPRLEPGVTTLGDRLVVLGGFDTGLEAGLDITTRVDVFDPIAASWSTLPDAPVSWTHIQLAAVGTTLYLLGGLAGQQYVAHGEAFSLDTSTPGATWQSIAPLPTGYERGSAAVIVSPPRIYLAGGASTSDAVASVIYYDLAMNAWCPGAACVTPPPDLPNGGRSHPAGMLRPSDNALVVVGGLMTLDATEPATDVSILPPLATAWTAGTAMPTPRGGCAYGNVAGQLVCAGGEAGDAALNNTEAWDPNTDTWTVEAAMPDYRAGTQGAAIGDRLFVPGGAVKLVYEPLDTVYQYAPLD